MDGVDEKISIAKLELCGAVLAARLVTRISFILSILSTEIYAFTDNTTVLCWLSKDASTWKTFVENRVRKIVEAVPFQNWNYVPTQSNPADLCTCWLTVADFLKKKDLWINGP